MNQWQAVSVCSTFSHISIPTRARTHVETKRHIFSQSVKTKTSCYIKYRTNITSILTAYDIGINMIVCCCFLSFWLLLVGYRCPLGALFLLSSLYLHYYYYHYSFLYFCLFIFIAIVRWWIDALNARERESKKQSNQKLMYFFLTFQWWKWN